MRDKILWQLRLIDNLEEKRVSITACLVQKYFFNEPLGSRGDDTHSRLHVITLTGQHVCVSLSVV